MSIKKVGYVATKNGALVTGLTPTATLYYISKNYTKEATMKEQFEGVYTTQFDNFDPGEDYITVIETGDTSVDGGNLQYGGIDSDGALIQTLKNRGGGYVGITRKDMEEVKKDILNDVREEFNKKMMSYSIDIKKTSAEERELFISYIEDQIRGKDSHEDTEKEDRLENLLESQKVVINKLENDDRFENLLESQKVVINKLENIPERRVVEIREDKEKEDFKKEQFIKIVDFIEKGKSNPKAKLTQILGFLKKEIQ